MIEIYKHQFGCLSQIISEIKNRNYRFIIYMDDLSFEESEIEYKYLKAIIEGGVETKPDNVLIYATSNRRHLIKETWKDRNDMTQDGDLHRCETIEEKLSLVNRFGLSIGYFKPSRREFDEMVVTLAARYPEIEMDRETLIAEAHKWEMLGGGISGRTAQQFVDHIRGLK
jgi:predicted AAA+ superfamily ATPase